MLALWFGCVPTGPLLMPLHINWVLYTSRVLQGFSSNMLLNKHCLCCVTECVYVAGVVSV